MEINLGNDIKIQETTFEPIEFLPNVRYGYMITDIVDRSQTSEDGLSRVAFSYKGIVYDHNSKRTLNGVGGWVSVFYLDTNGNRCDRQGNPLDAPAMKSFLSFVTAYGVETLTIESGSIDVKKSIGLLASITLKKDGEYWNVEWLNSANRLSDDLQEESYNVLEGKVTPYTPEDSVQF